MTEIFVSDLPVKMCRAGIHVLGGWAWLTYKTLAAIGRLSKFSEMSATNVTDTFCVCDVCCQCSYVVGKCEQAVGHSLPDTGHSTLCTAMSSCLSSHTLSHIWKHMHMN